MPIEASVLGFEKITEKINQSLYPNPETRRKVSGQLNNKTLETFLARLKDNSSTKIALSPLEEHPKIEEYLISPNPPETEVLLSPYTKENDYFALAQELLGLLCQARNLYLQKPDTKKGMLPKLKKLLPKGLKETDFFEALQPYTRSEVEFMPEPESVKLPASAFSLKCADLLEQGVYCGIEYNPGNTTNSFHKQDNNINLESGSINHAPLTLQHYINNLKSKIENITRSTDEEMELKEIIASLTTNFEETGEGRDEILEILLNSEKDDHEEVIKVLQESLLENFDARLNMQPIAEMHKLLIEKLSSYQLAFLEEGNENSQYFERIKIRAKEIQTSLSLSEITIDQIIDKYIKKLDDDIKKLVVENIEKIVTKAKEEEKNLTPEEVKILTNQKREEIIKMVKAILKKEIKVKLEGVENSAYETQENSVQDDVIEMMARMTTRDEKELDKILEKNKFKRIQASVNRLICRVKSLAKSLTNIDKGIFEKLHNIETITKINSDQGTLLLMNLLDRLVALEETLKHLIKGNSSIPELEDLLFETRLFLEAAQEVRQNQLGGKVVTEHNLEELENTDFEDDLD